MEMDNPNADTKIYLLSNEILVEIIKFVPTTQWPSLERVSRRFRIVVHEVWLQLQKIRLNENLLIAKDGTEILNSLLEKLIDRAPNLTELSGLSHSSFEEDHLILSDNTFRLLSQLANLRSVDISKCKMPAIGLADFLSTSSSRYRLKELKIDCELVRINDDREKDRLDQVLASAFGKSLKLEKLSLSFSGLNTFAFLAAVDVSRLTNFNCDINVSPIDLISFIARATNIERLEFSFSWACENSNDDLHLTQNKKLLQAIAESENLSSLSIKENCFQTCNCASRCFQFHREFVEMINALGDRLTEFSLLVQNLSTHMVVSAISNLVQLKSLELRLRKNISDDSLLLIVTKLKLLEKLMLREVTLNDHLVAAISTNLTELRSLDLWISEANSLSRLADLSNLKNLRIKYKGRHTVLKAATIKAWSEGFGSNLQEFVLSGSASMANEGLIALVENSPRLRILISGQRTTPAKPLPVWRKLANRKTTTTTTGLDRVLIKIASSCRDLRVLNLNCCNYEKTPPTRGAQAIVDSCSQLRQLSILSPRLIGWCEGVRLARYSKLNLGTSYKYLD